MLKKFLKNLDLSGELLKIIYFNFAFFSFLLGQPIFLDIFFLLLLVQKIFNFKLVKIFLTNLNEERASFNNALLTPAIEEIIFFLNFSLFCSISTSIYFHFFNPIKLYLEVLFIFTFLITSFKFLFYVFIQIKTRKSVIAFFFIFFRFERHLLINFVFIYYCFAFSLFNGKFNFIIMYFHNLFYQL